MASINNIFKICITDFNNTQNMIPTLKPTVLH